MGPRPILRLLMLHVTTIAALATAARGDTIHVPGDFASIQDAIDAASDGDTVLLAAGTYTGAGNRDLDFGGRLITVRGDGDPATVIIDCAQAGRAFHFHSEETADASVRNLTIRRGLAAEADGGAILCEASSPVIKDCVFVGNVATGTTASPLGQGGAIFGVGVNPVDGASLSLVDCIFDGNSVIGDGPSTGRGGAAAFLDGCSPVISGCRFTGNTATGTNGEDGESAGIGGALYCDIGARPDVADCVFIGNRAISGPEGDETGYGAAVTLSLGSDATFTRCTFTGNEAIGIGPETGIGGAFFITTSNPVIESCTFIANTATEAGGGLWVQVSGPLVRNCTFRDHAAQSGGAIAVFAFGTPTIEQCTFTHNTVASDDPDIQQKIGGGAIGTVFSSSTRITACTFVGNVSADGYGGAVSTTSGSVTTIANSTFFDNEAALSGGAVNTGSLTTPLDASGTTVLVNCLLAGNVAAENGGALFNDRGTMTATQCTVVGNEAGMAGGGVGSIGFASVSAIRNCIVHDNVAPEAAAIHDNELSFTQVSWSIVSGGWPGVAVYDVDPLFADPDGPDDDPATVQDNDYRPAPGSPAVDSADNVAVPADTVDLDGDGDVSEAVPVDLDDHPRFADDQCTADTGVGGPPVVDMGAYEFVPIVDGCDCNGNGVLDTTDIAEGTSDDFNGNAIPDECESPFTGTAVWANPDGGLFRLATNWNPGTPGPANPALFDTDAAYTVTFDQDAQTHRLLVNRGQVAFAVEPGAEPALYEVTATDSVSIVIGEAPLDDGSLTVGGGQVSSIGEVQIGAAATATGALGVSGTGTLFSTDESLCVGCFGHGVLLVENGGTVVSSQATIGDQPTASGLATVRGAGSVWDVPLVLFVERGTLVVEDGGSVVAGIDPFGGIYVLQDGSISGDGFIDGTVINVGAIEPAAGSAPLTIHGGYGQLGDIGTLEPVSGTLVTQIGGTIAGADYGQLRVQGEARLAGGLFATLADGYQPALGTSFVVVDADAVHPDDDRFDVAYMPALGGDLFMRVTYGAAPGVASGGGVSVAVETLQTLFGFGLPAGTVVPGAVSDATIGDLDGDGFPDLAIAIPAETPGAAGSVLVLLNDGTGTGFDASQQITVGITPVSITVGRFDADTALDLAVANRDSDTVSLLLNDGGGLFDTPADLDVGSQPVSVAAGRLLVSSSGDDLVVANAGDGTVSVLRNDGNGGFVHRGPIVIAGLPGSADPTDVDNDRDLDAVVIDVDNDRLLIFENVSVGDEIVFTTDPVAIPVGADPTGLARRGATIDGIDLDGNGFVDLVTANLGDGTVSVVLNEGGFAFAPAVNLPVGGSLVSAAALDLEPDGDVDLAVIATNDEGIPALLSLRNDLNDGEQVTFAQPVDLGAPAGPLLVLSGDLDLDQDEDLLTINDGVAGIAGVAGVGATVTLEVLPNLADVECVPADVDCSGAVDVLDLVEVIVQWGPCPPGPCPADVDGDGMVGVNDLVAIITDWT